MSVTPLPKLYTDAQVAEHLGVSRITVQRERLRGKLGYTRIGNRVRITEAHVDAYLKGQECGTTSESGTGSPAPSGKSAGRIEMEPLDADRLALEIASSQT